MKTTTSKMTAHELLRTRGGEWLGAARSWIQWNCHNGSDVTWGSDDVLRMGRNFTVRVVEEIAAHAVAAIWVEGAPKSVTEAAKLITRWHYGSVKNTDGEECVLVKQSEWDALRKAVEDAPNSNEVTE